MNVITDTWRALVRRRLWPIALLLLGALVAVPLKLAKDPAPAGATGVPVAQSANKGTDTPTSAFVELAGDDSAKTAKRRRVLGAAKDPFEPAPLPKAKKKKKKAAAAQATPTSTPQPSGSGGSSGPSPSAPPSSTPSAPKVTHPKGSLRVRFASVDTDMASVKPAFVERLEALPSTDSPAIVYTGLKDNGRTAVFMVTSGVVLEGDGKCDPNPENCETLRLHAGETEFVSVPAADGASAATQYQFDLVSILTKSVTETVQP